MNLRHPGLALPFSLVAGKEHFSLLPSHTFGQAELHCAANMVTGNLSLQDRSLSFADVGGSIKLAFFYNSLVSANRPSWQLTFGKSITQIKENDYLMVLNENGEEVKYRYDANQNCYLACDYQNGQPSIRFDATNHTWISTHPHTRETEIFNQTGQLQKHLDKLGNATRYEYDDQQQIKNIIAPSGACYQIKRTPQTIEVYLNTGQPVLAHTYFLDAQGRLKTSQSADGYQINYAYLNDQLQSVAATDTAALTFDFYDQGKLHHIQIGDDLNNNCQFTYDNGRSIFKDNADSTSTLTFDAHGHPSSFLKVGEDLTQYLYYPTGQIKQIIYPDDSSEQFEYDAERALLLRHTKRDGSLIQYTYSDDRTYPLLLSQAQFASANDVTPIHTTYYVYENNRLRFEISSLGSVKEYQQNAQGLVISERRYIKNRYVVDDAPTLQMMNDWAADQDLSQTTLKTFDYQQGRVSRVVEYSEVDAAGKGVQNDATYQLQLDHDKWGNITLQSQRIDDKNSFRQVCNYDDLTRKVNEIVGIGSKLSQQTRTAYTQNEIKTTLPNQRIEKTALNSQGLIDKKIGIVIGQETEERVYAERYKTEQRIIISSLPDQNKILQGYNKQQRLETLISSEGSVTTFEYSEKHRYQIKTEHAEKIDLAAILLNPTQEIINQAIKTIHTEDDRKTYTFFTVFDQPQYEIDAEGYLIEYQYNTQQKLINTIAYKDPVTFDDLGKLLNGQPIKRTASRFSDRITANFYDQDGNKILEQDPAGYLTQFIYDAAKRVSQKNNYALPNLTVSPDINVILPKTIASNDACSYYFYNTQNLCTLAVDAEGYITTHAYTSDKKKLRTLRYANKVEADWYQHTDSLPIPLSSTNDQSVGYSYDDLRRVSQVQYSSGKTISYTYDEMDHATETYTFDQTEPHRTEGDYRRGSLSQFDKWEQEVLHGNPNVAEKVAKFATPADKQKILDRLADHIEYNQCKLKIKTTDYLGNSSFYFYDKDQHLRYFVDATGAVTENILNAFGEIVTEIKYYNRLSIEVMKSLTGGLITDQLTKNISPHPKDQTTAFTYNRLGLNNKKIDPQGYVSEFKFDAFKQCRHESLPVNDNEKRLEILHTFEGRGLQVGTTRQDGNTILVSLKEYNHFLGKLTDHYDEGGCHTHYEHNRLGDTLTVSQSTEENNALLLQQNKFDAFSQLIETTNADHITQIVSHDHVNRLQTTETIGVEGKTIVESNIFHQPISVKQGVAANGVALQQESRTHAPDGQVKSEVNGLGEKNTTYYNFQGHAVLHCDALNTKTSYQYDVAFHLLQEVKDVNENGLNLATRYTVNALGQQEKIVDPRGTVTANEFDLSGSLAKSTLDPDGLNHLSQFEHNATHNLTHETRGDITQPNQFDAQNQYDNFKRLTAKIIDPDNLKITTSFAHDAMGNVVKETDPNGNRKRTIYNIQHKKRFELRDEADNKVSVIEYVYTNAGKLKSIRTYDTPLDRSLINDQTTIADLTKLVKQTSPEASRLAFPSNVSQLTPPPDVPRLDRGIQKGTHHDTITHYYYDLKGREQYKLRFFYDPDSQQYKAYVREKIHDAADREIAIKSYADAIVADPKVILSNEDIHRNIVPNPTQDRALFKWYDAAGRERILIDQNGNITEKRYNAKGKIIEEIFYHEPLLNPEKYLSINLSDLLSKIKATPEKDSTKSFVYDALDRLQFTVDANCAVKRNDYDQNNNLLQICEFKDVITRPDSYEGLVTLLHTLVPTGGKDKITTQQFDKADKIIVKQDALSNQECYQRNALGNVEVHTDKVGQKWGFEYDRAKRLVKEVSPKTHITAIKRDPTTGQLSDEDTETCIIKKKDYDKSGNTTAITEGWSLPEARTCQMEYNPHHKLSATTIPDVEIDDPNYQNPLNPDLAILPTQLSDIKTRKIYNTKGKVIAESHEDGTWRYHIYNAAEQLIYQIEHNNKVTQYFHNAFDVTKKLEYSLPLSIDLSQYAPLDITSELIQTGIQQSDQDRITCYQRNTAGKLIEIKNSAVFYYADGQFGTDHPTIKKDYNHRGDCLYEAKLIAPNKWAEKFTWVDKKGKTLATVDENNYLTSFSHDNFGNETNRLEYATALPIKLTPESARQLSVDELKKQSIKSEKDRLYVSEYDLLSQKLSQRLFVRDGSSDNFIDPITNVLSSANVDGKDVPQLVENRVPLIQQWDYRQDGKLKTIIHEDGNSEEKYHDERGILIAETAVSRTAAVTNKVITPLQLYKVDAFGHKVVKQQSPGGCIPTADTLTFVDPDKVVEEMTLFDNRGLARFKQDANRHLSAFTHTANRKIARELTPISLWQIGPVTTKNAAKDLDDWELIEDNKEALNDNWIDLKSSKTVSAVNDVSFSRTLHLDEKRFVYDITSHPCKISKLRDNEIKETLYHFYNIFGEYLGESDNPDTMMLSRKLDTQGRAWFDNNHQGNNIFTFDLRGAQTLSLKAPDYDLSLINYSALSELFDLNSCPPEKFERTEKTFDAAGSLLTLKSPVWYQFKDSQPWPTREYGYDRWKNAIKEIDSLQNVTTNEYGYHNHITKRTQPAVEMIDSHGVSKISQPVTQYGYNLRAFKIGVVDANQHTKAYALDDAGQLVANVLADGMIEEVKNWDAMHRITDIYDFRGVPFHYEYDNTKNVTQFIFPSGLSVTYDHDEKNNRISMMDSAGSKWRYNYDINDNVYQQFLPAGECTFTRFDHNRQPLYVQNPDNTQLTWLRDYTGLAQSHTDFLGKNYFYEHDFTKRLRQQTSQSSFNHPYVVLSKTTTYCQTDPAHRFPITSINYTVTNSPQQAIGYDYQYGLLKSTIDGGIGQKNFYTNNSEGLIENRKITDLNGTLLHDITTSRDALKRDLKTTHEHMTLNSLYATMIYDVRWDAVGNRRFINLSLDAPGYAGNDRLPLISNSYWNEFDRADRMTIQGGTLTPEGNIAIVQAQGMQYGYAGNFRNYELHQNPDGTGAISVVIGYTLDGKLGNTGASTGLNTQVTYAANQGVSNYLEVYPSYPLYHTTFVNRFFINGGWLQSEDFWDNNVLKTHSEWADFETRTGSPSYQTTKTFKRKPENTITDAYHMDYYAGDNWELCSTQGTRKDRNGTSEKKGAQFCFDANNVINGKLSSEDEPDYGLTSPQVFFETTTNQETLSKQIVTNAPFSENGTMVFQYLLKASGDESLAPSAGYLTSISVPGQIANVGAHEHGQSYQPSIYSFVFQQKDYAIGRYSAADRTAKNNPLGFNDPPYPVKNAPLYTVNIGDTLASIATQFFGDVAAVPLIARENGLLLSHHHLKPGTVLRLPQYFSIYNKATTSEPYQKFSSIMLGSLAPHMATPEPHKDHDSFFDFAKIIALAIIASIVATPATATFLLGLLGFTSTTTAALITTDVLAGLGDAAVQGVAIGLNAQSKFSLSEMFEFAISAGMGSGATLSPSTMTVLRSLFQETTTNITLQLAEMKLGLRDKFDAQSLVQQALSAVVGASISPEVKAEIGNDAFLRTTVTIADTAAESILGSEITNTPPNIEADVANVIGSVASSSIQKGMDDGEADDTQQADPMSQTSSSHDEIEQAEGVANFQVDDPTLPLDAPRYGTADYALSEVNRRRMQLNTEQNGNGSTYNRISAALQIAANSSIVSAINTAGEWLANTPVIRAINAINPIVVGGELLNEANQLYQQGDAIDATAAVGMAALSVVPGEALTVNGLKIGARYLVSRLGLFGGKTEVESAVNWMAQNQINHLKLSTELALKEANILNHDGALTAKALQGARLAQKPSEVIGNRSVIKELTKDESKITDWQKMTTQSIELPSGQRVQVHFYQNKFTGEINYTHSDFKVKNLVAVFHNPNSPMIVTPQSILKKYRS